MDNTVILIKKDENGVSLTTENTAWKELLAAAVLLVFTAYENGVSQYMPLKAFVNDFQRTVIATYDDYLEEKEKSILEE